ncbi:MAG: hypothetical protein WA441_06170 [Methyloceanibacter sp.]
MSDAGEITDPIEGVKKTIARSKDLIASATEELNQHNRWLKSYLASEKRDQEKYARWLKRQQVMHRRQLQRQRMIRSCKQFAWACVFFVRSVCLILLKGAISALIYLRDLLLISASWTGLKAYALALAFLRAASTASSWIALRTRALALSLLSLLSVSLSWIRVNGHALALALLRAVSTASSWITVKTRALALSLLSLLSVSVSWLRVNGHALALALLRAASTASSWIAWMRVKAHALALALALLKANSTASSWIAVKARALTFSLLSLLSVSFSWIRVKADALALALLNAASMSFPWIRAKARDLALSFLNLIAAARPLPRRYQRRVSALAGKLSEQAKSGGDDLKRSALSTTRLLRAWISESGLRFRRGVRAWGTGLPIAPRLQVEGSDQGPELEGRIESKVEGATFGHEEPTTKQSTALVCLEPRRNRLPVVQTS